MNNMAYGAEGARSSMRRLPDPHAVATSLTVAGRRYIEESARWRAIEETERRKFVCTGRTDTGGFVFASGLMIVRVEEPADALGFYEDGVTAITENAHPYFPAGLFDRFALDEASFTKYGVAFFEWLGMFEKDDVVCAFLKTHGACFRFTPLIAEIMRRGKWKCALNRATLPLSEVYMYDTPEKLAVIATAALGPGSQNPARWLESVHLAGFKLWHEVPSDIHWLVNPEAAGAALAWMEAFARMPSWGGREDIARGVLEFMARTRVATPAQLSAEEKARARVDREQQSQYFFGYRWDPVVKP